MRIIVKDPDVTHYVVTLSCEDRPGIVNAVTCGLLQVEANIVESSQFGDESTGRFFLRMVVAAAADVEQVRGALSVATANLGGELRVRPAGERRRTLIMVSRIDHCLVDLLYRWRLGELPIDIVGVVSNHEDCRAQVEQYGIPYHHLPVSPMTKAAAERSTMRIVRENGVELVVLARYMQVLGAALCESLQARAINIHHSFLPGFKGGRPYHQAHDRGVKLIGATAHYVTKDLDEGPIIEQQVVRVGHSQTPTELAAMGRDVESVVLARAVRAHAEGRVFVNGMRTVVFT
jgi:formyltetrahydrofolate deformylase